MRRKHTHLCATACCTLSHNQRLICKNLFLGHYSIANRQSQINNLPAKRPVNGYGSFFNQELSFSHFSVNRASTPLASILERKFSIQLTIRGSFPERATPIGS